MATANDGARARVDLFFEHAHDLMCIASFDGQVLRTNKSFQDTLGHPLAELKTRVFLDLVHQDDRPATARQIESLKARDRTVKFVNRFQCGDGSHRTLSWNATSISNEKVICALARDITTARQSEFQLRRSNQLLEAIARAQSLLSSGESSRQLFEGLLEALIGVTDSEFGFIGERFVDNDGSPYLKTHAISNIAWNEETRSFYDQNAPAGLEFRNLQTLFGAVLVTAEPLITNTPPEDARSGGTPAGHPQLRSFMGLPFFRANQFIGMVGVANRPGGYDAELASALDPLLVSCANVIDSYRVETRQKSIQSRLTANEAHIRGILEAAADAIISIDEHGKVLAFNPAAEGMFGFQGREIIGRNVSLLMPSPFREEHDGYLSNYLASGIRKVIGIGREAIGRRRDGSTFPLELTVSEVEVDGRKSFTGIVRDISERKQVESELAAAHAQLASVLNAATQVAIVMCDMSGLIRLFNSGAEKMLGYKAAEVLGIKTPAAVRVPSELEAYAAEVSKEFGRELQGFEALVARPARDEYERREWTFVRKDGSRFQADVVVTAVRNKLGEITGFLGVVDDITKRKEAETELNRAREAAEAASRAKGEFLAKVSHEIRTPMNVIIGMAELALDTNLSSIQRDYVGTLRNSAQSLLGILNDILDFSKVEAGHIELVARPFSLRQTVEETLKGLSLRANDKGLSLQWKVADDVLDDLIGDALRLRQVLINLIGNAIKFTPKGSVYVTADTAEADEHSVSICFRVTDTGIGIAQQDQTKIFESFRQADDATTRTYGGTGLGLTISAMLVELLGGQIWVDSELNRGSTFQFTASFERGTKGGVGTPAAGHGETPSASQDTPKTETGISVLLVEDHRVNRHFASELLKKLGHSVTAAVDGSEAVALFESQDFDLILMDIEMPRMDGFEATALIRSKEQARAQRIPIVALTAHALKGDRERFLSNGFDEYLSKPFSREELMETIAGTLSPPSLLESAENPLAQPVDPSIFNIKKVREACCHDDALLAELVGVHFEESGDHVEQIMAGIEAEDYDLVRQVAHRLKASAGLLAAERTYQAARTVEEARKGAEIHRAVADLRKELEALDVALRTIV